MSEVWAFSPSRGMLARIRAEAALRDDFSARASNTVPMAEDFNFLGACGEAFFGGFLGYLQPPYWGTGTDPGFDFRTKLGGVDVKATSARFPRLMVGSDAGRRVLQADVFVLVQIVGRRPNGNLIGWATKKEVLESPVDKALKREPRVVRKLRPIGQLMEAIR